MKLEWQFCRRKLRRKIRYSTRSFKLYSILIQSNIRELESALTRLLAYSQLLGKPITTELTAEALKDIIQAPKSKKITIQDIQKIVGQYYNVRIEVFQCKNVQSQLHIRVK